MNKPKNPVGRPKKAVTASDIVRIRCIPEQKAQWQKAADKSDKKLSAWIKDLCDKHSQLP